MTTDHLSPLRLKYKAVLLGAVVILSALAGSAAFGKHGWKHLRRLERRQERLEALAVRLERDNQRLRDHLRRLDHDDAYLERVVRERLGWVRPGEMVYRVSRAVRSRSVGASHAAGTR